MEILIMTCGTGGGHNAAARAMQAQLTMDGHRVTVLNPYDLKDDRLSKGIDLLYIRMVQRSPRLFGMIYRLGNLYRRLPFRSPVYHVNGRMAPVLEKYLEEHSFDALLMTHLYPAEMVTRLRRLGAALPPTVFIATDYTCIPFTEETECGHLAIPSEKLVKEYTRRGIPREKLWITGIPTHPCFRERMTGRQAKERLGLDEKRSYVLVCGGSMGAGSIKRIAAIVNRWCERRENFCPIIMCGSNRKLYRSLRKRYGHRMILLSYTEEMDLYMKASELVLTKPGGLSSTETAVAQIPMIHITPIPGCETKNMKYFVRQGMSLGVKHPGRGLEKAMDRLLQEPCRETMKKRQQDGVNGQAARTIEEYLVREERTNG